jgi:hypothetical protein
MDYYKSADKNPPSIPPFQKGESRCQAARGFSLLSYDSFKRNIRVKTKAFPSVLGQLELSCDSNFVPFPENIFIWTN